MAHRIVRLAMGGLVLAAAAALPAGADTYTVTTTADSGAGSLRQAITDANGHTGADDIHFDIPGTGVHVIAPATALPKITGAVTIDGYTQSGASANSNAPDQGLNTVLTIEIDCTSGGSYCLQIGADDVTIRGLAMVNTTSYLIATDFFKRVDHTVIEGCFLGTHADGLTATNAANAVILGNHQNARVGGTTPAARNLFAGSVNSTGLQIANALNANTVVQGNLFCTNKTGAVPVGTGSSGIVINGGAGVASSNFTIGGLTAASGNGFGCRGYDLRLTHMTDVRVQGNRFGVDPTGTKAILGGEGTGIYIEYDGDGVVVGGTAAGAANVIGGHLFGISSQEPDGVVVQGNFVGTEATGTRLLGNANAGINLGLGANCVVGGTASGEANVIMNNRGGGVTVSLLAGNTIRGNRIVENLGTPSGTPSLGIDLATSPAGVTANDAGDADTGANDLQNFPLITSAVPESGGTRVIGSLNSTGSSTFHLDFYSNPVCRSRPRSALQADRYLGGFDVSTNASGDASFNTLLPAPISAGQPVTATATNSGGSTSELSPEIVFSTTPDSGVSTGGQGLQIKGMLFSGTPAVTIGGVAATNVNVSSATQLTANAPALPAAAAYDLVVSVSGGPTGRLKNGYVSLPTDAVSSLYSASIAKLIAGGITQGCGAGIYCPDNTITRAEMSIFLIRAKYGLCFTPPPATGTMFTDVAANAFGARQIELLASLGVSTGCGGGKFCPNDTVTRDQMAVFLLRTLLGSGFVPPAATGKFTDVPVSNPFAKWIEELSRRNITGGCGFNLYCPANSNTRGEMAAFIVRTFGLP
ncbi:MAG TPA: S-layer homology domain-containing protein [Thermoanaerobaculia bacterium]|nr:S-layer homology domain-containing protein [Thermoanaerobaculia bacterium]